MKDDTALTWIPVFDSQNWKYQSYLLIPTVEEKAAPPGNGVTAKKWASGVLHLSSGRDAYAATGTLVFAPGASLSISVTGTPGIADEPAPFEAKGTGMDGAIKGAVYELVGWAFRGSDGKVESVRGCVRAIRGSDSRPGVEPGGMPIGTVGYFVIDKAE